VVASFALPLTAPGAGVVVLCVAEDAAGAACANTALEAKLAMIQAAIEREKYVMKIA
jgi:hypothetical protein